jgi:estrone sulfotransferase
MNLIHKLLIHISGILGLKENDVLLSSFPRSGNTWIRFLIANYLSMMFEEKQDITFPVLDGMMPEIGANNLLGKWPYDGFPRVVKTHWRYNQWFFRDCRSIGIIRDPRDAMISYYRFVSNRDKPLFAGNFQAFIRASRFGMEKWFCHTRSWLKHWDLIVRYEDLHNDTEKECRRIFRFLGVEIDAEMLWEVVERANIRRIADSEDYAPPERLKNDSTFRFVGTGGARKWVDSFTNEDIDYFISLNEKYNLGLYR